MKLTKCEEQKRKTADNREGFNILGIYAHPDDETIFIGGVLAMLARAGLSVHYLCATRGEGGELGEPEVCTREQLGNLRTQELSCAVKSLAGTSLSFLDYIDPQVEKGGELQPFTDDQQSLIEDILQEIDKRNPAAVITHGSNGEYGHPAHKLVHNAVKQAIGLMKGTTPVLYSFSANYQGHPRPRLENSDDPAHMVVDIQSTFDQKVAAAYCHKSQNALFVRRSSKRAGRSLTISEVLMKKESLHRVVMPSEKQSEDIVARLLVKWIVKISE